MGYKIIAVDGDGTLFNSQTQIPAANKAALQAAQRAGVHIALSSGRAGTSLWRFADELELDADAMHVLCFNGGAIFNGRREKIFEVRMERAAAMYVYEKTARFGITTLMYDGMDHAIFKLPEGKRDWHDLYQRLSGISTTIVDDYESAVQGDVYKVLLTAEEERLIEVQAHMKNHRDYDYAEFFTAPTLLEFTSSKSTKGQGLDFVCRRLGLDISKDAIAIGDSFNDLSMIKAAALGVCMKNGAEAVKEAADYVTLRGNDECGVAEVVERFVLG